MKTLLFSPDIPQDRSDSNLPFGPLIGLLFPGTFWNWAGVTLLCFLASWGGIVLGQTPAQADIFWPANGLLLAFLLRSPRRFWFGYTAGSALAGMAAHMLFPFSLDRALVFTAANTVEVFLAAVLLADQGAKRPDLTDLRTLGRFVLFAVLLAPLASMIAVQILRTIFSWPADLLSLVNWFAGDAMGIAIMTPLVLAMDRSEIAALFSKGRRFETVSLLAGVSLLSLAVFARSGSSMVFVLFPALLLVIFRLGSAGSAIGVFLMVTPAAYLTTRGTGPFSAAQAGALNHSIFLLQAFLGVSLVTIYAVSAALAERNRLLQELTEAYRVADSHAGQDHLTGLANRRTFDEQLKRAWKQAVREKGSLSLLMMDVDYFKLFNDRYGHLAGDECLRTVGSILAAAPLRGSDLAARFGGEEFAVLLPRAGTEGAFLIADRIRQALADRQVPHIANPASIATVSIGVATLRPTAEADEKLLIQRADMALYQAKKGGRNQVQAWEPAPE